MIKSSKKSKTIVRSFLIFLFPLLVLAGNYTVKKWDTIWDLSGKYLGDPYSWERIWAVNQHINDPHWIYPGDVLNIPGAGNNTDNSSSDIESSEDQSNYSVTDLKYTVPSLNKSDSSVSSDASFSSDSYKTSDGMVDAKAFSESLFRQIAFLWDKPNSSGVITPGDAYIFEKKEIGTFREYVDIKCTIEAGNGYSVGDTVEIIHPIRIQKLKGKITNFVKKVALATVTETYTSASGQAMMKIRIFKLWDSVVNMDRVIKAEKIPPIYVESVSNPDRKLTGELLINAEKSEISYVFKPFILNIGKTEGVQIGDLFLVNRDDGTEVEKIPSAMGFIIHTTDLSSTLMITNMRQLVKEGDQVSLFKKVTLR